MLIWQRVIVLPIQKGKEGLAFKYRNKLDQSTLCALLSCKLNNNGKCYELATLSELANSKAKTATMEYIRAHGSKDY